MRRLGLPLPEFILNLWTPKPPLGGFSRSVRRLMAPDGGFERGGRENFGLDVSSRRHFAMARMKGTRRGQCGVVGPTEGSYLEPR